MDTGHRGAGGAGAGEDTMNEDRTTRRDVVDGEEWTAPYTARHLWGGGHTTTTYPTALHIWDALAGLVVVYSSPGAYEDGHRPVGALEPIGPARPYVSQLVGRGYVTVTL